MKLSTVLALGAAPLAMAKAVRNTYAAKSELVARKGPPSGEQTGNFRSQLQTLGLSGAGITTDAATQVIIIWVNPGNNAPAQQINPEQAPALPAVAAPGTPPAAAPGAATTTHNVMVGGTAGLTFAPSEVKAAVGDMVIFTFMAANHSVTQSTFDKPCEPMAGGMDSGFQANPDNAVQPPPQVAMQVMVDTPLWFYCKQKGHCGKGMTFSINPTAEKTQSMFQAMAIAQNGDGSSTAITGGTGAPATVGNGSAAPATPALPAVAAPASGSTGSTPVMGSGSLVGGVCQCAVTCTTGSLPAANAQGLGSFGGMTGSLPMAMSEPVMNAVV